MEKLCVGNIDKAVKSALVDFLYQNKLESEVQRSAPFSHDAIDDFCNTLIKNTQNYSPVSIQADLPLINFAQGITPGVLASSYLISTCYHSPWIVVFTPSNYEDIAVSINMQITKPRFRETIQFLTKLRNKVDYFETYNTFDKETFNSFLFKDFPQVNHLMNILSSNLTKENYDYELQQLESLFKLAPLFELLLYTPVNLDLYEYSMDQHGLINNNNHDYRKYRSVFYVCGLVAASLYPHNYEHTTFAELWGMYFFQWIGLPTNTTTTNTKFSHPCMIAAYDVENAQFPEHVYKALAEHCGVSIMVAGTTCKSAGEMDQLIKPIFAEFTNHSQVKRNSGLSLSWRPETMDGWFLAGLPKRFNSPSGLHTQIVIGDQLFYNDGSVYFIVDYTHLPAKEINEFLNSVFTSKEAYDNFFNVLVPQHYKTDGHNLDHEREKYMLNLNVILLHMFMMPKFNVKILVLDLESVIKSICAILNSNEDSYASSLGSFWDKHPKNYSVGANLCMEVITQPDTVCSIGLINLAPYVNLENPGSMLGGSLMEIANAIDEQFDSNDDLSIAATFEHEYPGYKHFITEHEFFETYYPDATAPMNLCAAFARVAQTLQLVLRGHTMNMRLPSKKKLYKKSNEHLNIAMGTRNDHLFVAAGRTLGERTVLNMVLHKMYHILNYNAFCNLDQVVNKNYQYGTLLKVANSKYFQDELDAGASDDHTKWVHNSLFLKTTESNKESDASNRKPFLNTTERKGISWPSYDEVVSAVNLDQLFNLNLGYKKNPAKIPACGYTTAVMPSERLKYLMRAEGQLQGMPITLAFQFTANTRTGTYNITMPAINAVILAQSKNSAEFQQNFIKFFQNDQNFQNRFLLLRKLHPIHQIDLWAYRNKFISQSVSIMLHTPPSSMFNMWHQLTIARKFGLITLHYYKDTVDTSMNNKFNHIINGHGFNINVTSVTSDNADNDANIFVQPQEHDNLIHNIIKFTGTSNQSGNSYALPNYIINYIQTKSPETQSWELTEIPSVYKWN